MKNTNNNYHNNDLRKFYFVRHGATDWNMSMINMGPLDYGLNHLGQEQARLASMQLRKILDMQNQHSASMKSLIISSPLLRAKETSEIVAHQLGHAPIVFNSLLQERYYGNYQNLKSQSLEYENSTPDDVETLQNFQIRSQQALNDIVATVASSTNYNVIVVSHGGIFEQFLNIFGLAECSIDKGQVATFDLI